MKLKAMALVVAAALVSPLFADAQDKGGQIIFQDSETHMSQPELRVFVNPQVCDLEMIYPGKPRTEYQQYFPIRSVDTLTEAEFTNLKNRALYHFAKEHGADIIIEPIFNSIITDKDSKRLLIMVTGYPAKYVNFRPLGKSAVDLDMVRTVYPAAYQNVVESKKEK